VPLGEQASQNCITAHARERGSIGLACENRRGRIEIRDDLPVPIEMRLAELVRWPIPANVRVGNTEDDYASLLDCAEHVILS
jgi:hypothetical protein